MDTYQTLPEPSEEFSLIQNWKESLVFTSPSTLETVDETFVVDNEEAQDTEQDVFYDCYTYHCNMVRLNTTKVDDLEGKFYSLL